MVNANPCFVFFGCCFKNHRIGFILACKERFHSCRRPIPRQSTLNQSEILSHLRWYSFSQHTAAFTLPRFVEQQLEQKYDLDPNMMNGEGGIDMNGDYYNPDDLWDTTAMMEEKCFHWFPCLRSWLTAPTSVVSSPALSSHRRNDRTYDNDNLG